MADRALVGPSACCWPGGSSGNWMIHRGSGGSGRVGFPVAGLVSAKSLVRGEPLVTNRALVRKFPRRRLRRRFRAASGGGGSGAAGEHDEAESEVLLFGWWVFAARPLRALPLCPWLFGVDLVIGLTTILRLFKR